MSSQSVPMDLTMLVFFGITLPALALFLITRGLMEVNGLLRVYTANPRSPAFPRSEDGVYGPALAAMGFAIVVSAAVYAIRKAWLDNINITSFDNIMIDS